MIYTGQNGSLNTEVEACWQQYEIVCGPHAAGELEDMLILSGLAATVPQIPTLPRRIDSKTHRYTPPAQPEAPSGEPSPLRPQVIDPNELDSWGKPLSQYEINKRERDEPGRILDEGRKQPYLKGWQTQTTAKQAETADRILRQSKAARRQDSFWS